jgi:hypothetical protein
MGLVILLVRRLLESGLLNFRDGEIGAASELAIKLDLCEHLARGFGLIFGR